MMSGKVFSILAAILFILLYSGSTETIAQDSLPKSKHYTDHLFFIDGQLCQHVRNIFEDSQGTLWFATNVYGLMRYDGDSLVYFNEKHGLGAGRITGIEEDSLGNVWFGTYGGLTKWDGTAFTTFTEKDGLIYNEIWDIEIDRNGIIWIATSYGVNTFDGTSFSHFELPRAKITDTTFAFWYERISRIIEDSKGNLWFGTDGFGITIYHGNYFSHLTKEMGLCGNIIMDIMQDSKGNMWVGSMYEGFSIFNGSTFTNFKFDEEIGGVEAMGFFEDENNHIWFSIENTGVFRYDGTKCTLYNEESGLETTGILSILKDRKGRFWFGGWGGLFRYDGEQFFSVTKEGPWK